MVFRGDGLNVRGGQPEDATILAGSGEQPEDATILAGSGGQPEDATTLAGSGGQPEDARILAGSGGQPEDATMRMGHVWQFNTEMGLDWTDVRFHTSNNCLSVPFLMY